MSSRWLGMWKLYLSPRPWTYDTRKKYFVGFLVIGIAQLSTCWMLALFPRQLPKVAPSLVRDSSVVSTASSMAASTKPKQRTLKGILNYVYSSKTPTWKLNVSIEFPAALRRLLTNRILILNNLAGVFFVFSLSGYLTFLPKYMETQFQQSASRSGIVNGNSLVIATPSTWSSASSLFI